MLLREHPVDMMRRLISRSSQSAFLWGEKEFPKKRRHENDWKLCSSILLVDDRFSLFFPLQIPNWNDSAIQFPRIWEDEEDEKKEQFWKYCKTRFWSFFFERKSFSQLYQTLNNVKSNIVWQMKIMLWWRTHQVSSLNALEIASYKNMLWKGNKTCFEYLSLYARRMKRKRFSTSSKIHTFRFIL